MIYHYHCYDYQHTLLTPARWMADGVRRLCLSSWSPLSYVPAWRMMGASAALFEQTTRRFGQPEWGIHNATIGGKNINIYEETLLSKPFCQLVRFRRETTRKDPRILIVAPLSGHYSTLVRGTVQALLPHHEVYVTNWTNARQIPLHEGQFNLDDYIAYMLDFIKHLGHDIHVIGVCQSCVPVLAAAAILAASGDKIQPRTLTLLGGSIDARISQTQVNKIAQTRPLSWFEKAVITTVPPYYPGAFRKVYPGYLRLGGFMAMNLDRHIGAHLSFFRHLVQGDGDSAEQHKAFYNEYNAVMDIPAEYYLQTLDTVLQRYLLARGDMVWKNPKTGENVHIQPEKITHASLFTIEGELDDICAPGQTKAAHLLCSGIQKEKHYHRVQNGVGHYGLFNGRQWRNSIMPRIRHFIRASGITYTPIPTEDLEEIPDILPDPL